MSRILIVDDEPAVCWSLKELLSDRGHDVQAISSMEQAWELLKRFAPQAIILDVRLPGEDGLTSLPELRRKCPNAPVIVVTAFGDLSTAVTALARGAFDYLVKPFELARMADVLERALSREAVTATNTCTTGDDELLGRSLAMQAVFRQIALIAPTDFPVLLSGETGTGKEVAARAIHRHSQRADRPFVAICLAALNPGLIESELFGHVRGSFTGATQDRPGLLELARDGTVFLDEIAETPLSVQVKLLRVLETRRYCPVGSGVERVTEARFLAATYRSLPNMIRQGTFREDLYHRLKVFTVTLPPLRERLEDVPLLVESVLRQLTGVPQPTGIGEDFWQAVSARHWPGNVRELKHAVEYAAVVARGSILRGDHLPPGETPSLLTETSPGDLLTESVAKWVRERLPLVDSSGGQLHRELLEVVENRLIQEVLSATQQNRSAAAKLLGLDRATLRAKLRLLVGGPLCNHEGNERD